MNGKQSTLLIGFAVGLWLVTESSKAGEIQVSAMDDAVVTDTDGDAVFDELLDPAFSDRLKILKSPSLESEQRVLLAFDLTESLDAPIAGGSIEFFIDLVGDSSEMVNIVGYAGDGALDLADADRPGELIGSYVPGDLGIGSQSVELDGDALARLLASAPSSIEIRFEASAAMVDTSIDKVDPLFTSAPPMLRLSSVPEPGTIALLGVGWLALGVWRGRSFAGQTAR